jgi:hypothetical protein
MQLMFVFERAVLLFGGAVSLALVSTLLLYAMIGQVNQLLPDTEQISYLFMYAGKAPRVKREYKRLFPRGRLATIRAAVNVLSFLLLVICAVQLGFFR